MLTDTQCKKAACPADKARARIADAGGLYLEIASTGSKRWFWKYLFDGKEKRLALGSYPDVPLKAARELREDARKLQRQGVDSAQQRQLDKLARKVSADNRFEAVSREFHGVKKGGWSETYAARWLERLEKDVFPWIGSLALRDITAPLLLQTLRRVEALGVRELPHSLSEACGQMMRYAVSTGRCDRNPAADLRDALKPTDTKHMAAVVEPDAAGKLMRSIAGYEGDSSWKRSRTRNTSDRAVSSRAPRLFLGRWTPTAQLRSMASNTRVGQSHPQVLSAQLCSTCVVAAIQFCCLRVHE